MIKQFAKGRTCIKSTLEIGLMEETRQDWLASKILELDDKLSKGEIEESVYNDFLSFRDLTLE